jgi:hypothetical protein
VALRTFPPRTAHETQRRNNANNNNNNNNNNDDDDDNDNKISENTVKSGYTFIL